MQCPHCHADLIITFQTDRSRSELSTPTPATSGNVGDLLAQITDEHVQGEPSQKFVAETRARYAQYGERIRFSEKQMAWLQKIAASMPPTEAEEFAF